MKKGILIFGTGKIADVIYYYAKEECGFNVVAFVIDEKYKTVDAFHDLPVLAFETIEKTYPPSKYDMFVAVGYHDLNKVRETKCKEAIAKGYQLVSVVSPKCNLPVDVKYGYNCFIMPPAIIHPYVEIENNVFIWSGAMVGHHSKIKSNTWLTSCCNVSGNVAVGENTFIAVNATVGHGVIIGERCFLGANTLLTKNLEEKSVLIAESSKKIRLNSEQFLRVSNFNSI
jgi:sugar O-acyltransferase (sialic acid O-acetyltransferase NeuD family)